MVLSQSNFLQLPSTRVFSIDNYMYEKNQAMKKQKHNNQFPVGLLAQLVERSTCIAKVMGSIPYGPEIFFRSYFNYYFSSVRSCKDRSYHIHKF